MSTSTTNASYLQTPDKHRANHFLRIRIWVLLLLFLPACSLLQGAISDMLMLPFYLLDAVTGAMPALGETPPAQDILHAQRYVPGQVLAEIPPQHPLAITQQIAGLTNLYAGE